MDVHDISLEVSEQIATITLQRPKALNAFTDTMEAELLEAFDFCDENDEVRAVILTGSGRAFCSGMDMSDDRSTFENWRRGQIQHDDVGHEDEVSALPVRRDGGGRVVLRIFASRKPVIAAINGHAVGVGITMTLAADIRVAAEDATIGFVFNRRGLVPESCSTWFLPRVVSVQTALEWMLTGRMVPAREALDRGLLRSIHPRNEVLAAARAIARDLADNTAPVSVALSRQMIWRMLGTNHPLVAHQIETHALNVRGVSEDAREGISAFLEKRRPRFTDTVSQDLPNVLSALPTPTYRQPTI